MSPMLDIQRRHAEVFRLRFGDRGPDGYPRKLTEAIRITAPTEQIVAAFTDRYGGDVAPFNEQTTRDKWQAYLPVTSMAIMVLPGQSLQQWWERYRRSVCDRRCDGETETKSGKACQCPPDIEARIADKNACSPMTRVSVLCPDVAVVGSGSFVSHGLIAAETLPQSIAVAEAALSRGLMVPATLTISEVRGRNHFIFPQIAITGMSLHELVAGGVSVTGELGSTNGERQLMAGPQAALPAPHLTPVPAMSGSSAPSVREQVSAIDAPQPRAARSNAAEPIRPTGLRPRTAEQANAASAQSGVTPAAGGQEAGAEATDRGADTPESVTPGGTAPPPTLTVADIGKRASATFAADYEATPKGHKTKVVDRLRHAVAHVATGGEVNTVSDCTQEQRVRVAAMLYDIQQGRVTYVHEAMRDDGGVTFTLLRPGHPEGDKQVNVSWTVLEPESTVVAS